MIVNKKIDDHNKSIAESTEKTEKNTKGMSRGMKATAASGVLFAGAMATSMFTTNETAGNIANMAMMAAMILPMGPALGKGLAFAGKKIGGVAKGFSATAAGAARTTASTLKAVGPMAALRAGGAGLASSLGALVSPVGIAVAALGAGVWFMSKLHKEAEATRKEEELRLKATQTAQAEVLTLTRAWADETGRAWKNYALYNAEADKDYKSKERAAYYDKVKFFEEHKTTVTNAEGKEESVATMDRFNDLGSAGQAFTLANVGRQAVMEMGMNTKQATQFLAAFLDASGKGFDEAQLLASQTIKEIGGTAKNMDWKGIVDAGYGAIREATADGNTELVNQLGEELGTTIGLALKKAKTVGERQDILDGLSADIMGQWEGQRAKLETFFAGEGGIAAAVDEAMGGRNQESKNQITAQFEEMTASADAFRAALMDGSFAKLYADVFGQDRDSDFSKFLTSFAPDTKQIENSERAIMASFGNIFGLSDDVDTLNDALNETNIQLMLMGKGGRTDLLNEELRGTISTMETLQGLIDAPEPTDFIGQMMHETLESNADEDLQEKFDKIATILRSGVNVKAIDDDMMAMLRNFDKKYGTNFMEIIAELKNVENAAKDAAGKYTIDFDVSGEEAASILRDSMSSLQQQIADDVTEGFDRQMNAAIDSRQEMWDRRADALSADLERRGRLLDKKWERKTTAAENYWDRRTEKVEEAIEAEQKADEMRQKMFDAEIARIEKMNEMLNRNIDFNVALSQGNFDEAAKIRNDATADADMMALEKARDAGGGRSDRRIENLEGPEGSNRQGP